MKKYFKNEDFTEPVHPNTIEKLGPDAIAELVKAGIIFEKEVLGYDEIEKVTLDENEAMFIRLITDLAKASHLSREKQKTRSSPLIPVFVFDALTGGFKLTNGSTKLPIIFHSRDEIYDACSFLEPLLNHFYKSED